MAAGVKDANGTVASSEFDVYDRPVRVTVGVGLTGAENTITEMSYPTPSANESKVSRQLDDTRWLTSRTQYDGFGRPVLGSQAEDGLKFDNSPSYTIHAKTIYDGLGRAVKTSNPYRSTGTATTDGWTRVAYDLAGRVIEVATFAGDSNTPPPDSGPNSNWTGSVVTSYSGEVTTVRDQANKQRRSTLDALGRLVVIEEMNEYPLTSVYATTSYGYDARGNLLTVTQAQGATTQVRRFAYDLLSRLLFAANPEQETSSNALFSYNNQQWAVKYTYDAASNLTAKSDTRPVGSQFVTASYQYDALNRVTQRSYNDGTPTVTYSYDTASNGVGRLRSVTAAGVSTYNYTAYDKLGRVTAYNQVTEGQTYLMENTYNKAGLVTSEKYPSQKVMLMEYDAAGRPAGIKKQGASFYYAGATATDATNRVQYTAAGAMSVMKLGNNLWEHTTFNSRLQPTQIGLGVNQTSSSVLGLDYTYSTAGGGEGNDNNGNVRTQTINAAGAVIKQSYSYDVVNRLGAAQESIKTKLQWQQSYSFDRWGNRTGLVNSGPKGGLLPTQSTPAIDSTTNRLAGEMYDGAGNLLSWPQNLTMQYDAESRLVLAREPGALRFEYDGDGRRVKKINDDGEPPTTVFVYDVGGRLVAEYESSAGSLPNVKVSYLTADHLGSTRVVTESNGAVRVRRDYLPYGEEIPATVSGRIATPGYGGSDATRQKFTAKERDSESGLDYFGARYYSSAQGRFTSVDRAAIGLAHLVNPQNLNKYSYVLNDPLNRIDISGLFSVKVHEEITFKALRRVGWTRAAIAIVAKGNASVDIGSSLMKTVEKTLNPFGNNPKHSMLDVYIRYRYPLVLDQSVPSDFERSIRIPVGTEKQSVESAKAQAKAWIDDRISTAADLLIAGSYQAGLYAFGEALHTIQDEKHGWITLLEHMTDLDQIKTDEDPTPEQRAKAERDTRAAVDRLFMVIRNKLHAGGLSEASVEERLYEIRHGLQHYQ